MTTTTRPLVLNVTEAGNLLGVSRSTAYELVRTGELESVQLRRRVVVPVAAVAERLGITVPDVWLALGRRGEVAHSQAGLRDRLVPDVLIEDIPAGVHAELTRRARRRGQSLQQFLQTELEHLARSPTADDVLDRIERHRHGGQVGLATAVKDMRPARP
ncbi:helix-turn-helix domain-containing protein [Acidimicrobiia bacterium EGI L10123]|uniref:helix-turn-helix domain-containing protein n=1 Tax=Salinilacustrithrix flava TaxID=2957203 RepID=UPI003D7C349B|nr:helix-turn-helix domain-containing protein [Acidimicrobiia bacterium EGI L10123]